MHSIGGAESANMKKNVCDGIMRKSLFEDSVGDLAVGIGMQIERRIKKQIIIKATY